MREPENNQILAEISRPELLLISGEETAAAYGCDQDWYPEHWQRQAGCGPCTAATILYYLSRSHPHLDHLYTANSHSQEDFTHFMGEIWHYVTPGRMGVNEASILANGVRRYAAHHQVSLQASVCAVPNRQQRNGSFDEFAAFIRQGLMLDCPVAFLNLSNGSLNNLDSWHWVAITKLQAGQDADLLATIADSGERKVINLSEWYRSSWLGGAAVWFSVDSESLPEASPDRE